MKDRFSDPCPTAQLRDASHATKISDVSDMSYGAAEVEFIEIERHRDHEYARRNKSGSRIKVKVALYKTVRTKACEAWEQDAKPKLQAPHPPRRWNRNLVFYLRERLQGYFLTFMYFDLSQF